MSDPTLFNAYEPDVTLLLSIGALALLLMAAWFLVVGYSMKFALAVAGVGKFGFWKSMLMVFVAGVANFFVSSSLTLSFPGNLLVSFFALLGSVAIYCLVISLMSQCSFGKGFIIYLLNGLFNFLGLIPVAILLFIGVFALRPIVDPDGTKVERWKAEIAQVKAAQAGNAFAAENAFGTENVLGTESNVFNVTEVANPPQHQNQAAGAEPQPLPRRLPAVQSTGGSSGGRPAEPNQLAPASSVPYSNPFVK